MRIWTIITPEKEYEIEISKRTLLYNYHYEWNQLTRIINNFFNARNSNVEIFEDGIPIIKKDWKCYFIPYDVNIQLSKVTASSPLKEVQNNITEQLVFSPLYQELVALWEQLNDELEFVNKKLKKWKIKANLNNINEKSLSQFINFLPIMNFRLLKLKNCY